MQLYDSEPEGAPRGAVIVIQEAFGITDHIKDICHRLSAEGYRAVAPHLFHRSGDPVIPYDDMAAVMPHIAELSGDGFESDLAATLGYLESLGFSPGQVGVVGFCMGGTFAAFAAAHHTLGAVVTFYGGGIAAGRFGMPPLLELAPMLETPWLGLFGDQDQSISTDEVESMREAVKKASVPTEVVRYADATHGFNCDARDSYHEPSANDGWARTLDWFADHIVSA
jgi:carboxymethylenebutenolidase